MRRSISLCALLASVLFVGFSTGCDRDVIVAGLAWNTLMELLEHHGVQQPEQLPEADRARGRFLHESARMLADRALRTGPHIRRRFPVVRAISLGFVDAAAQRQPPFR